MNNTIFIAFHTSLSLDINISRRNETQIKSHTNYGY